MQAVTPRTRTLNNFRSCINTGTYEEKKIMNERVCRDGVARVHLRGAEMPAVVALGEEKDRQA